jgi:hypothetical protein
LLAFQHPAGVLEKQGQQCRDARANAVGAGGPGKQAVIRIEQVITDDDQAGFVARFSAIHL